MISSESNPNKPNSQHANHTTSPTTSPVLDSPSELFKSPSDLTVSYTVDEKALAARARNACLYLLDLHNFLDVMHIFIHSFKGSCSLKSGPHLKDMSLS